MYITWSFIGAFFTRIMDSKVLYKYPSFPSVCVCVCVCVQVCVRGLMHIVKWMEGLEKHGSDPHLLSSSSLSSREASLARRKGKRHSTSRSYIDSIQPAGENG